MTINYFKPCVMISVVLVISLLAGCAASNIGSPCPNFGKSCRKIPINSWDYQQT